MGKQRLPARGLWEKGNHRAAQSKKAEGKKRTGEGRMGTEKGGRAVGCIHGGLDKSQHHLPEGKSVTGPGTPPLVTNLYEVTQGCEALKGKRGHFGGPRGSDG